MRTREEKNGIVRKP